MADIAIKVDGVSKTFKLPHEKQNSIKGLFVNIFRRKRTYEKQQVLEKVSFEVERGEFFGIVGRNGSGKSTLLKLLAGIYTPDKGNIQINGKLTPFIELGVGFNPELTGRENVFLNGALLGFSRKEMEAMYDEIVEFAELEKFMDQKLKNYSSGMQVRLAFSIAIRANTDILVLDEVLAVGDEAFQRKCYQYFAELKKAKKTVILVTHSMDNILQFCTRAMLIDKGHETKIGNPLKIAQIYRSLNNEDIHNQSDNSNKKRKPSSTQETKYLDVKSSIKLVDSKFCVKVDLRPKTKIEDPIMILGIYGPSGEQVYRWSSDERAHGMMDLSKPNTMQLYLYNIFPTGVYTGTIYIKKQDRTKDYAVFDDVFAFEVKNHTPYVHDHYWKIPEQTIINGEVV